MNKRMISLALALLLVLSVVATTTTALAASCTVCGSKVVTTTSAWEVIQTEYKEENGAVYGRFVYRRVHVTRCTTSASHLLNYDTEYKRGLWFLMYM
ncbi:MAG: hypothetical protein VB099_15375 [Candidatus Limiplasma sp.]|nr:hypothetical protein [Candidatus Limiplasma sp.]